MSRVVKLIGKFEEMVIVHPTHCLLKNVPSVVMVFKKCVLREISNKMLLMCNVSIIQTILKTTS